MREKVALIKQSMSLKGGLEKHTLAIALSLIEQGFDVDLICQAPCHIELPGLKVIKVASKKKISWLSLLFFDRAVKNHLKRHSYRIILGLERHSEQTHYRAGSGVHRYYLDQRVEAAPFLKKLSLILNPFHRLILKFEALTFGQYGAKKIYTNSHGVAAQIIKYYHTDPSRIKVIYNGVEWKQNGLAFEKADCERMEQCKKFNLLPTQRYLLFIGNGFERKGLFTAIQALHLAKTGFHLLVVGKDSKSAHYQKLASQLQTSSRVHFMGYQSKAINFYQLSEALVLPSNYDPFANATIEALSMGLFVLTTRENGASEIIDAKAGKILNKDHLDAWSQAYEELWNDPHTLARKNAIRQTVKKYEFKDQIQKLILDAML